MDEPSHRRTLRHSSEERRGDDAPNAKGCTEFHIEMRRYIMQQNPKTVEANSAGQQFHAG